jgi:hypothetical protein
MGLLDLQTRFPKIPSMEPYLDAPSSGRDLVFPGRVYNTLAL